MPFVVLETLLTNLWTERETSVLGEILDRTIALDYDGDVS